MLEDFQGDSWGSIPPLRMSSLLPHDLCHGQSASRCPPTVAQSCPTLYDPADCSPPSSSNHGDSPGKNTGVGGHSLLQGILPTQGSNLHLLALQVGSLPSEPPGKCINGFWKKSYCGRPSIKISITYNTQNLFSFYNLVDHFSLLCPRTAHTSAIEAFP